MRVLYPTWLPVGGLTLCQRLILINAKHRGDTALLRHEEVHADQMRRVGTLVFWWRYLSSKAFRQASEVEAYKVQITHGASVEGCAKHLSGMYRLGLTQAQAVNLLES